VRIRFAAFATVAVAVLALPEAAFAADDGSYAAWARSGSSGAWQAAGTPAAGFPVANVTSNASTLTAQSGANTWLGPQTPPGQVYGSSQGQGYLNISTATGFTPSTSTMTFDSPTPANNWAFILGDLDADMLTIAATDANGNAVSTADLGFQGTFNYCAYSPKPGTCTGAGPFTHVPTWLAGTATLVGDGDDTLGAAAWFQPTVALKSITFTFARISGSPIFQLWLAAKAVPVIVPINGGTPDCEPSIELDYPDGTPVVTVAGPVVVQADSSGTATIPAVIGGDYSLHMTTPKCATALTNPRFLITVDPDAGPLMIPAGTFVIEVPQLADTGQHTTRLLAAGAIVLLSGAVLVVAGRRRTR